MFNKLLNENPSSNPALLLNEAFTLVDKELASKKGLHSGCTAIVAYIRSETRNGESKVRKMMSTNRLSSESIIYCKCWGCESNIGEKKHRIEIII